MRLWLSREVAFHPRGYYRLALSIAKREQIEVWGRPFPPIQIEGPLEREIDESVWRTLTASPSLPPQLRIHYMNGSLNLWQVFPPLMRERDSFTIVCNPVDLWRCLGHSRCLWDVWEDYARNFQMEPTYSRWQSLLRRMLWRFIYPLRMLPQGYTLAEYAYAPLVATSKGRFLPNAFVSVQSAPPLLPRLSGDYALYTGNITFSWGILEAIDRAVQNPAQPLVIAGSPKSPRVTDILRGALKTHPSWLWIRSRFVPYPVIQNLQRYSALLYAFYQPLPHLCDKVPGKFYEAAAQKIPILYPVGRSSVWDAFWKRYRNASDAPELYWSYYEGELWDWIEALRAK
ncbi:MAG: hypothetical protein N2200_04405 [Bacteroidia bacterium]|nr:hypothetical protein [Bacteroidia bacterium]